MTGARIQDPAPPRRRLRARSPPRTAPAPRSPREGGGHRRPGPHGGLDRRPQPPRPWVRGPGSRTGAPPSGDRDPVAGSPGNAPASRRGCPRPQAPGLFAKLRPGSWSTRRDPPLGSEMALGPAGQLGVPGSVHQMPAAPSISRKPLPGWRTSRRGPHLGPNLPPAEAGSPFSAGPPPPLCAHTHSPTTWQAKRLHAASGAQTPWPRGFSCFPAGSRALGWGTRGSR